MYKKCIVHVLMLTLYWLPCNAQYQFTKQWDQRYGGTGDDYDLKSLPASDGGYLFFGGSNSENDGNKTATNRGDYDYWLVKTDSNGVKEWDKAYGGNRSESPQDIIRSSDGQGYILAGYSFSGVGGDKSEYSRGGYDFWIIKIDENGNKIWDKTYGGSLDDLLYSICSTKDGGYLLGGASNSPISGDKTQANWDTTLFTDDYWVVKIDSHGNKQWDRRYGGSGEESLSKIFPAGDNCYLLSGHAGQFADGDLIQPEGSWLLKVDSAGNILWQKGGYATPTSQVLLGVDGGFVLGGSTSIDHCVSNYNTLDYGIIKIDSAGNTSWIKVYGGDDNEYLESVTLDQDQGLIISGGSQTIYASCDKSEDDLLPQPYVQGWVIKVDSNGNKIWDKTIFTNNRNGGSAIPTKDGCYLYFSLSTDGIGYYKSQPCWDTTQTYGDYWALKFCMSPWSGVGKSVSADIAPIAAYPNPFTDHLNISLTGQNIHEATFSLSDISGHEIYRKAEKSLATGYTKSLNLQSLPAGVYLVTVQSPQGLFTKRVVKLKE